MHKHHHHAVRGPGSVAHMEHPSKRRRVERRAVLKIEDYTIRNDEERPSTAGGNDKLAMSGLVLPSQDEATFESFRSSRQEREQPLEASEDSNVAPLRLSRRQVLPSQETNLGPGQAYNAVQSVQTAAQSFSNVNDKRAAPIQTGTNAIPSQVSIVAPVVINTATPVSQVNDVVQSVQAPAESAMKSPVNTTNSAVSKIVDSLVPTQTSMSQLSQPVHDVPGEVSPLPALAASVARDQALATQEATARQLNEVPALLSTSEPQQLASTPAAAGSPTASTKQAQQPASSAARATNPAASQSPMSIYVPSGSSQQVLSSPSTPLSATPASSNQPSNSATSYFSSSLASASSSNLPPTSSSPAPSKLLTLNNSKLPSGNNSTILSTTVSTSASTASLIPSITTSATSGVSSSLSATSTAFRTSPSSLDSLAASLSASSASVASQNPGASTSSTQNSQNSTTSASSILSSSTLTTFLTSASSKSATQTPSVPPVSSSSSISSSTGANVGGAGGPSNTGSAPSSTSSSGAGSGGNGSPPTPVLVGGIVGGVAGLVMVLLVGLLLLRWRRGKTTNQRRDISPPISPDAGHEGGMTQRSSNVPIAAAGFFGRLRPASSQTAATTDTTPSERGFQKISGRKLPSVLTSGGDGYGDVPAGAAAGPSGGSPATPASRGFVPDQGPHAGLAPALRPSPPHSLSGSSFYRDSQGFYGGVVPESSSDPSNPFGSPASSSSSANPLPLAVVSRPPQGSGSRVGRDEIPNIRPGPARTPVINQPGFVLMRTPSRAQPPSRPVRATPPPIAEHPRDGLGRSHPSQDGSHPSRFREQV